MDTEMSAGSPTPNCVKGYQFTNWSKTFECSPELYFEPSNLDEIREILNQASRQKKKVKVVGNGHSPSDIQCTSDYMICLRKFNKIIDVNKETQQIKAQAGTTLHELHQEALKHGLGVSPIPSVSHISLAGLIATGTHSTGANYGILATNVTEMTLMDARGEIVKCNDKVNKDIFDAARCHVGAVGIILDITWQCEKAYRLCSKRMAGKLDEVLDRLENALSQTEHYKFHWWPHTNHVAVWDVVKTDKPVKIKSSWFWDYLIGFHLLQFVYWLSTFFTWLVPYINKYHFTWLKSQPEEVVDEAEKIFTFDCLFAQYVNEWAIPREKTPYVLRQLKNWLDESHFYAHMPVEVRFVAKDDIYLSPAFGRDVCFIGIIMYRPYGKLVAHEDYWNFYEDLMLSAGGRPHWGKAHKLGFQALRKIYPSFDDFRNVCAKLDPDRLFVNEYLERTLFPPELK
ncbi:L-gulonolactone oxidase-like isoform X2 [Dendronephthya gigantea]|uniref:L-gulonolactone oxidase-like isoform X2 n=1 Tax=Dendronephthya gigantea TaxID=151771 RepID=UPI00106D106E|nr:L-gulonolactone oxidase-like isoform X2 [Dendronephthya gigantea]